MFYLTTGYGTTHKVNNIVLQGSFQNRDQYVNTSSPKKKRSRRSFCPTSNESEVNYRYKKRVGPSNISFPENEASEFILDDSNKRHFLWALMRYKTHEFIIPSWTGYQICISKDVPILKTNVGYLDCIDESATEMSTIYQVLFFYVN